LGPFTRVVVMNVAPPNTGKKRNSSGRYSHYSAKSVPVIFTVDITTVDITGPNAPQAPHAQLRHP